MKAHMIIAQKTNFKILQTRQNALAYLCLYRV